MPDKQICDGDYVRFRDFLERRCGIVLGENKQYLVRSRLSPLMRKHGYINLSDVVDEVVNEKCKGLVDEVVDAMTTNETLWFRDSYPFQLLAEEIFPKFKDRKQPLKIWSAACSSGQEPYSLAMTVLEFQRRYPSAFPGGVQILGTDISSEMLNRCKEGAYDSLSLSRGLSEERKRQFFDSVGDGVLAVKSELKRMVSFRSLNLLDPISSLGRFDIVFCRNVLIYFSSEMKSTILSRIASTLNHEGALFLGASESMSGLSNDFNLIRCPPGLYYSKK
ncbi:protein-glutamate O-methyltransferase CheR [Paraneptunicella aestuarii]|uniref:CheR family methyltransferase n=1 Tax=Paraneptunicella aestuarii TaxID=2831148 RepID=UPI001E47E2E6|nr:protein-glutamate O-methyltransferase CheR [Paraneptunicella aestuarii]UAA39472.1 protein-glutamate O-methyltransferase CheR [Paraneptunicella aestuarii]